MQSLIQRIIQNFTDTRTTIAESVPARTIQMVIISRKFAPFKGQSVDTHPASIHCG